MKTFITGMLMVLLLSSCTHPKTAIVHITVKNSKSSVYVFDPHLLYDLTKGKLNELRLTAQGNASYTMNIDQPSYLILHFPSGKILNYSLFLTPGDELFLSADFSKKNPITITGKGSNNNQPEIFALNNLDTQPFNGEKNPIRVIAAINKQYLQNKSILANYIKVNKPSAAFIKNAEINLKYFVPEQYYEFSHNHNLFKSKEELKPWLRIQDSLFSTIKLSNDEALFAYNYDDLISNFVMREAEAGSLLYKSNPQSFYQQWFHSDPRQGKKIFDGTQVGLLNNMVIDKYFSGKAAENAYGQTIKFKFMRADYPAVTSMYDHFKKEFPTSRYIKGFNVPIAEIVRKQQKAINSNTIFVRNNGTQLNTLNDVLALTKGKVALIDMWGTWCSPCREEIEKNAVKLEHHFKNKNVNFIYIANFDIAREQEWKKMIAYFQIEGIQILANAALTKDIEAKVKLTGYPTYIIVNKDGSYRTTSAQLPMNLQAKIKEIETANL